MHRMIEGRFFYIYLELLTIKIFYVNVYVFAIAQASNTLSCYTVVGLL